MKRYMFRTVRLSIISSLLAVHSAMVYVIQVCRQLSSRTRMELSCSKAVYKPVWHIPLLSVQRINYWWWTDELSETCSVSWQNKFVKLVHLFGFITKKFVTIHGHMNVKFTKNGVNGSCLLTNPSNMTVIRNGFWISCMSSRQKLWVNMPVHFGRLRPESLDMWSYITLIYIRRPTNHA